MVYQSPPASADLDAVFSALAHPARRSIVQFAATQPQPPTMTSVASAAGVSPQMLNKHALILERAGIAMRRTDGRERHFVVNMEALAPALSWITSARAFWSTAFDNLDAYAATLPPKEDA